MKLNRPFLVLACASLAVLVAAGNARAQAEVLINTTEWVWPIESVHCVAVGAPCSISAAIERGQSSFGAVVTACFTQGDPRCLQEDDPNYDPATGIWHIQLAEPFNPFVITSDDMELDFTRHVDGWSGPQDNRIVLDIKTDAMPKELFIISGSGNQFAGFDIGGDVSISYFVVRAVEPSAVAMGNVFGPGLVLADHQVGVGIRLRGAGVSDTEVKGIWCGIRGDGTTIAPMSEHCLEMTEGAHGNKIGSPKDEDRNYFAASLDSSVQVSDAATRDNVIEGNTFGFDITGKTPAGGATGITLVNQASGTKVFGNIISGHTIDGILADNTSTEFGRIVTRIEDNWIGVDADGQVGPGNGDCGIVVRGLSKNVVIKNNRIWRNHLCGITISGANARDNTVTQNSITRNDGKALLVLQGANGAVAPPVISVAAAERISGSACPRCVVELFSDPVDEAEQYEGSVEAAADGTWAIETPTGVSFRFVTATATDGKDTSALSDAVMVERGSRPTRTPTGAFGQKTPTVTRTPDVVLYGVLLPWTADKALR